MNKDIHNIFRDFDLSMQRLTTTINENKYSTADTRIALEALLRQYETYKTLDALYQEKNPLYKPYSLIYANIDDVEQALRNAGLLDKPNKSR